MELPKLKMGDVIELGAEHIVNTKVPEHFLYTNRKGSFDLANGQIKLCGDYEYLAGIYVVTHTVFDGGGKCHNDEYPNGHHVHCEKVDDRKCHVDFYQSGCFTTLNENVPVIGRATRVWVYEPEKETD